MIWDNIITPVKVEVLEDLLLQTKYNPEKTQFLINGFKHGFDIGYRGDNRNNVQQTARNLKLVIGNKVELWNKVMKEVKERRYAGPFSQIPFDNYIQSPIGLVPKDGGKKTRLIFHLSYPRDTNLSVNANTPKELSTVKYQSFDDAVKLCILAGKGCHAGKSDLTSAFRHLCIRKQDWCLLVMKAESPLDGKTYFFVDKCLPFGASISCAHFQAFSDALSHIVKVKSGRDNINYLDDFFFAALRKLSCNDNIQKFIEICKLINFPVSAEKTEWGTTRIVFLGLLIDTINQLVCVPQEKIQKALQLIHNILSSKKNKTTLSKMQKLTGFLNFIGKSNSAWQSFHKKTICSYSRIKETTPSPKCKC